MKVAFIVPMIAPYRVTFFEKLSGLPGIQLRVFYGVKATEDGRPAFVGDVSFDHVGVVTRSTRLAICRITTYERLAEAVQDYDPDVVVFPDHCATATFWRIAHWVRRERKRLIIWCCGWDGDHVRGIVKFIRTAAIRRFVARADCVLCYGSKAKDRIVSFGVALDKIAIAYNGIEIDDLQANRDAILAEGQKLRNGQKTFLYVGGVIPEKKVSLLLEAFAIVKQTGANTRLWIVGDGPDRGSLEKYTADMRLADVTFWGRIIQGVDKFFAGADYFVLPGAGGLAINQAMYWGLPCIAAVADGTEEDLVIPAETGFRFDRDDADSLARTMTEAIRCDRQVTERMGNTARQLIVTRSNVNEMVKTFHETFLLLAKGL
jgi:glycosyltransferase involved in cell wall biosynthesis